MRAVGRVATHAALRGCARTHFRVPDGTRPTQSARPDPPDPTRPTQHARRPTRYARRRRGTGSTIRGGDSPLLGFGAVLGAAVLSSLSSVYFERILKRPACSSVEGAEAAGLWLRNVQLGVFALPLAALTMVYNDGEQLRSHGVFHGFDSVVWMAAPETTRASNSPPRSDCHMQVGLSLAGSARLGRAPGLVRSEPSR